MCEDVAVVAWAQLTSAQFKPLAVTQFPLLTSFSTEISLSTIMSINPESKTTVFVGKIQYT
jgi:hypothetical protein